MKTIVFIVFLASSFCLNAQKTYLKIYKDNSSDNVIMYPPGTKFELRNPQNYIILKNNETPSVHKINGDYTLTVYPNYKKDKDVYKLTKGKVELALTKDFGKRQNKFIRIDKNAITAHKKVTDSEVYEGEKNLEFELSNGITFSYKDGKYYAKLKDDYLNIKHKYIIESKLGTLKLSFNSSTGTLWWYFEKK